MRKLILPSILTGLVVILIWIFFPLISHCFIKNNNSIYYEAFGALFSALAFVGVILTLIIQSNELEQSVKAQEKSAKSLELTIQAETYFKMHEILQSKDAIKERQIVFDIEKDGVIREFKDWKKEEKDAVENLIRQYDAVGIMAFNKMLPVELIVDSWGISLRKSWVIVKEYLEHIRKERKASEYWDDYEWLVIKAYEYEKDYINQNLTYQSGNKIDSSIKKFGSK